MSTTIYSDGNVLYDSNLNGNYNVISKYIATNKINNAKITIDSDQIETTDDSQTLLFGTTSDLESGTYNQSTLHSNDNYAWYDSTHDIIYAGVIYDNYSDGSVDATKWTGSGDGTTTETANTSVHRNDSNVSSTAISLTLSSTGSSGIDLKPNGTNTEFFVTVNCSANSNTSVQLKKGLLYLRDGSGNEVLIYTLFNVTNGTFQNVTKPLRIILTSTQATVYTDRDTSSTVDISSLVGTGWYLKLSASSAGGNPNVSAAAQFYPIVYVNTSTIPASTIETVRTSVTPTVAAGFVLIDDLGDGLGTSTIGISADNGSNYTTVTHKTWGTISNTGTTVSTKHTLQGSSREKLIKIESQCLLYSD